jgi:GH35 family endo-1,4-beta-xylanase
MKPTFLLTAILCFGMFFSPAYSQVETPPDEIKQKEQEWIEKTDQNIEKYRKGKAVLEFTDSDGNPIEGATIRVTQESHDFLFGAIIFELIWNDWTAEEEQKFKSRFSNLFNFATLPYYWASYESRPGHPLWQKNEEIIEWCNNHGITTKGHPLGWSHKAGTPEWLYDYSKETAKDLYKGRIYRIVSGFKGQVDMWDVVNEGPHTVPWERALDLDPNSQEGRYSTEIPLDSIVPFVEKSHHWAHDANPGAELVVNDYRQIADEEYRQRFYDYIKLMLDHNTPIHAIGIQAHEPRHMWFPPADVWETLNMYQELDLPIQITEVTIQSGGTKITGGWREGTWDEEAQADATEQLYRLCFAHPAVESINYWGFSDPNAWLKGGGIVDGNLDPKPVYERLDKLINEEWMTSLSGQKLSGGEFSFRGFYGEYKIELIMPSGRTKEYNIHLREDEDNKWGFEIER